MPQSDLGEADSVPLFDETRVPVETIALPNPATAGVSADEYEIISQKGTYRLAQRPGSYVVLKYVRDVAKIKATQTIHCAPAPAGVLEGSRADVSFCRGSPGRQIDLPHTPVPAASAPGALWHPGVPPMADADHAAGNRVARADLRGAAGIRQQNLTGEANRQHRLTHSKPRVEAFFGWIDGQFERQGLLPSSPFTIA